VNHKRFIVANVAYYIRFYRLIALATLIMTAVVTGSLLVGGSVRATLLKRVNERLGEDTETVVFARYSFFDSELVAHPLYEGKAKAILLSNGFISDAGRLLPVRVYGVDDPLIPKGNARVNPALATELSPAGDGNELALRLPATGLVPSGSLFVTSNYTTSARLKLQGVLAPEKGGNLSLKNEQIIPYNLFMNRQELAAILEVEGKINLLLCRNRFSMADFATTWTPALSGIRVTPRKGFAEVTSDRVFLQQEAVENIRANNTEANCLFSYMANEIASNQRNVPYSFVTAADSYNGISLQANELILTDYTARRLNAQPNDTVRIAYFWSEDLKTLRVDTFTGRVTSVLPLKEVVADTTLSAYFPGLTDVEWCTDWDSDLPIDMKHVTQEDEDYWAQYRSTPKAILPYQAVAEHWGNAYGNATAIRIESPDSLSFKGLEPSMFGLQIIYPREAGIEAAQNGIDFSSLFLSLGFFIILSAVLLMMVPLSEMIHLRREEIALLSALGYPAKRIAALFRREALPVVLLAAPAGTLAGLLYTRLILILLGSLWKGATHTGGFMLFFDLPVILAGGTVGLLIAWLSVWIVIGKVVNKPASQRQISETFFLRKCSFGLSKLIGAGLSANKKRAWLSFVTLASGVLIVFSVGLNRREFADHSQLLSGTGGYTLWSESNVPLYHNIRTPEGRSKLALNALPKDAQALQLFRYGSDDASCLNLNKVSQPTVLGVDMEALKQSDFRIQRSIFPDGASVYDALQTAADSVYPTLIDETTLTWGLRLKIGDTLRYESNGRKVCLQLSGTIANSVFQGNILIHQKLFAEIWGEITGSEVMLLKVNEADAEETRQLLSQALSEYGVRVTTTAQRLKEFNSVTDTYLTIFLTLGGLGLLLGIISLVVVIRKDLASRAEQIKLYRSLGFPEKKIARILSVENLIVPLCAVCVGGVGSLAGVSSGGVQHVGLWIWLTASVLALLLVLCIVVFIHQSIKSCLMNKLTCFMAACLLPLLLSAQTAEPQLWGKCSLDDLRKEPYAEWYTKNYADYEPNPEIIEQLKNVNWKDYSVSIFLGTWCGDSRREVPRFIKMLDAVGFLQREISLIAISAEDSVYKQSLTREERGRHIYRAPTFILSKKGGEVNRIVETPVVSLERDLLAILNRRYTPNYASYIYLSQWFDEGALNDKNVSHRGLARQIKHLTYSVGELNNYGYVLSASGNKELEAAVNVFQINTYLYPDAWQPQMSLAEAFYRKGDAEQALRAIQKAIELNKDVRNVKSLLELEDEIKQLNHVRP
jgi:putative ABC transport system permease protein